MKKTTPLNVFTVLSVMILLMSCGGGDKPIEPPTPPVTIPTEFSNISLPETPGNQSVTFMTTTSWSIEMATKAVPDWITVSPMNGGAGSVTLTITTKENTTTSDRAATITIKAGGQSFTMTATQKGKTQQVNPEEPEEPSTPTIAIDKVSQSVGSAAGSFTVGVTSNSDWTTSGAPTWITLSPINGNGDKSVTLTYQANPNTTERSATIMFTAGNITKTLTVTQDKKLENPVVPTISIDKSSQKIGPTQGSFTVEVTSNADWTTSGVPAWITISPASGNGDKSVTLVYQANPNTTERSATITFTAGDVTKTLTVTQNVNQLPDFEEDEL